MVEPRILHSDDDRVIAAIDALVVLVARRPATPEHIRKIDEAMRDLAIAHPTGVGYVHIADSRPGEVRQVPDETRKALLDFARNAPPAAIACAVTMLADGFVAATLRGVAGAAIRALRVKMPMKVFSSIEESATWLEVTFRAARAPIAPAADLARAMRRQQELVPSLQRELARTR